jgi:hypothetical protein
VVLISPCFFPERSLPPRRLEPPHQQHRDARKRQPPAGFAEFWGEFWELPYFQNTEGAAHDLIPLGIGG